jgi:hypothetical protein
MENQSRTVAVFAALLLVVVATTLAQSVGWIGVNALAADPARIAAGKIWLLISSGLLVQKPVVLSLVSFAALGSLTLLVCGRGVLGTAALLGHVGSTLITYGVVAIVSIVSPETFRATWSAPDYGVSAIAAAWLGAVACVCWRRRGITLAGKAAVAGSCLAVAAFGWMMRRHHNVLDSEHALAFAIGVALSWRLVAPASTFAWRFPRRQARQLAIVAASVSVALVGASLAEAVRSRERPHFSRVRVANVGRNVFAIHHGTSRKIDAFANRALQTLDPFFPSGVRHAP